MVGVVTLFGGETARILDVILKRSPKTAGDLDAYLGSHSLIDPATIWRTLDKLMGLGVLKYHKGVPWEAWEIEVNEASPLVPPLRALWTALQGESPT